MGHANRARRGPNPLIFLPKARPPIDVHSGFHRPERPATLRLSSFEEAQGRLSMTHAILRLPAVKARTGLSRSTIYLRVAEGGFPKPVSLGGRAVGWLESEIQDWLQRRIDASRQGET
jgi:prophage regulatory protein